MTTQLLKLGTGNAKLKDDVGIFDLPAGWTCPQSCDCGDKVDPQTGKLISNPDAKFRCFAANSELISKAAREKRWHNYNLIKNLETAEQIAELIINSINGNKKTAVAPKMRIHSSGDFFNQKYFNAWVLVAKAMPEKIFYAYTKSLTYWVEKINDIPENLFLTASRGGKNDDLIEKFNLKNVLVVYSLEEAKNLGLEIDHDDSHCYNKDVKQFALLIHGTQKAGSKAMDAIIKLRKDGIMGYQRGSIGERREERKTA